MSGEGPTGPTDAPGPWRLLGAGLLGAVGGTLAALILTDLLAAAVVRGGEVPPGVLVLSAVGLPLGAVVGAVLGALLAWRGARRGEDPDSGDA